MARRRRRKSKYAGIPTTKVYGKDPIEKSGTPIKMPKHLFPNPTDEQQKAWIEHDTDECVRRQYELQCKINYIYWSAHHKTEPKCKCHHCVGMHQYLRILHKRPKRFPRKKML